MGELQFQQRWEFRRNEDNDPDSSFDNSKSSNGALLNKHKLVSSLVSVGDDDTSETSGLKQKDNENPGRECQIRTGKAKKRKSRNLQNSKMKRDSPEEVDLQKGKTSAYDPAPLDDLKNFMDSLLRDLKVTRENLLKWMIKEVQNLVADDDTTEPKRRKCVRRREKVQLQQTQKSKKVQDKHEKAPKESKQFQHPNNSQKSIQVQHRTNFQPPVHAQQQSNFQESINLQVQLQEEENTNKQLQNDFRYGMRTQNSNNRSLVGFPRGINAADFADYFNALGDGNDSGQVTELITSSKNKGDILSKSAKPNLQTSSADQNVQVQSHNSVVLAIEAQNSKARSLKRSAKGKKTIDLINHYKGPEDQGGHGQAMRTVVAGTTGEKLGSSAVQSFLSNPCGQETSSMYNLLLPTVLTEPIVASHGLDASFCNYIPPGDAENKRGVNSERRMNQMLEPSFFQGSFPVIPADERIRSFALRGSKNMDCINQNSTPTSGTATAFPVPLHQGIDVGLNIPRQVNPQYLSQETSKPMGLRMNGAVKFPGGSYNLSEHIAANNHPNHPGYQSDSRLMSYQIQNIKDGHFFLQ